jgi:hypothetical protein
MLLFLFKIAPPGDKIVGEGEDRCISNNPKICLLSKLEAFSSSPRRYINGNSIIIQR